MHTVTVQKVPRSLLDRYIDSISPASVQIISPLTDDITHVPLRESWSQILCQWQQSHVQTFRSHLSAHRIPGACKHTSATQVPAYMHKSQT